jgi:hypothetical protein
MEVKYLEKRWCILNPVDGLTDKIRDSVGYACGFANCTILGYKTSRGTSTLRPISPMLTKVSIISIIFNSLANTTDIDFSYVT